MYYKQLDKIPQLPEELAQDCINSITDKNITVLGSELGLMIPKPVYINYNNRVNLTDANGHSIKSAIYKRYDVSNRVAAWVQENIHSELTNNYRLGVQVFEHPFPGEEIVAAPHIDGPRGSIVMNFILSTGGPSVTTEWYIEKGYPVLRMKEHRTGLYLNSYTNLDKLCETTFPQKTWVGIEARAVHALGHLTSNRIALSVGLTQEWWNDVAKRYG